VAIVEHWNPHAHIRQDLFGVFDLLAVDPNGFGVIGIQVKGQSGTADGVTKLRESAILEPWLRCLNRVLVVGWRKLKVKRGGKAVRWHPRVVELYADREEILEDPPPGP
jgi:hypothetical protein